MMVGSRQGILGEGDASYDSSRKREVVQGSVSLAENLLSVFTRSLPMEDESVSTKLTSHSRTLATWATWAYLVDDALGTPERWWIFLPRSRTAVDCGRPAAAQLLHVCERRPLTRGSNTNGHFLYLSSRLEDIVISLLMPCVAKTGLHIQYFSMSHTRTSKHTP